MEIEAVDEPRSRTTRDVGDSERGEEGEAEMRLLPDSDKLETRAILYGTGTHRLF